MNGYKKAYGLKCKFSLRFPVWLRIRLISVKLKPVPSQIGKKNNRINTGHLAGANKIGVDVFFYNWQSIYYYTWM